MTTRTWIRQLFARTPRTIRKTAARRRPTVEALEDRAVPAVTFDPAVNLAAGSAPGAVAAGDFNGDGKQDLAVANALGGNVSVLLGTGAGAFAAPANYAAGPEPNYVAVGDFNGDGKPDLAVTNNRISGTINVLLGTGTGTFPTAVAYAAGFVPQSVAVGDFNGDGKPDLAAASVGTDSINVLLGTGSGTFAAFVSYAVGSAPQHVAVGDFNGDGKPDLAAANGSSGNVSILLGTGTGAFAPAFNFAAGGAPESVEVGDFNGDGKQDLATANQGSDNVSILLGTGTGTFAGAVAYPAGARPDSMASGDFNGDGKIDLAVANFNSNNVSVLLGTGTGAFQSAVNFAAGIGPRSVAVADFNGDGKPDLTVAASFAGNDSVSVLMNTTVFSVGGTFQNAVAYPAGIDPQSVAEGDFNGDGKRDLAVANFSSNNVSVLLGTGAGTFFAIGNFAAGARPNSVAVGDFNRDGKADLAVANRDGGNISILLGTGTGIFLSPANFAVGAGPVSVAVGDFNGDGKQDLAAANQGSETVSILLGTGAGTFADAVAYPAGGGPVSVAVGDFNGDGKQDLAVANRISGTVGVLLGSGTGAFPVVIPYVAGSGPQSVAVGDFNGDGKQDLAVANSVSNNVRVLLGTGAGGFLSVAAYPAGTGPVSVAAGDFNGDGKQDLAVANLVSNNVSVLLGTGAGAFAAAANFGAGNGSISVAVGDFNRDGKQDLAVANQSGNNVSVLLNIPNTPPTANAGGPYTVAEGGSVGLSGAGSSDPDQPAGTLTYAWDLDGDNVFGETGLAASRGNETGITPTFSAAGLDGPGSFTVRLRVTDNGGLSSTAPATVGITNVAPTLAISGASSVNEGATYTLNLSSSDPGPDTIISWAINWGDGTPVQTVMGNPSSVTHVYADGPRSCTVSATATDEDGTYSANAGSVTVINVPPTITTFSVPAGGSEGSTVSLSAAASDPAGANDPLTYTWTITRPDGSAFTLGAASASFTPAEVGSYSVTLAVSDGDGGSATASATVQVGVRVVTPNVIKDDGEWGFQTYGTWQVHTTGGYQGDYRLHPAGAPQGSGTFASWLFEQPLGPGSYELFVSWVARPGNATNATYKIYDGSTVRGTVVLNQRNAPNDGVVGSTPVESLGVFQTTTSYFRVELSSVADGDVVADAVFDPPVGGPGGSRQVAAAEDVHDAALAAFLAEGSATRQVEQVARPIRDGGLPAAAGTSAASVGGSPTDGLSGESGLDWFFSKRQVGLVQDVINGLGGGVLIEELTWLAP